MKYGLQYCVIRGGHYRRVKKQEVKVNFFKLQKPAEVVIKGKAHVVEPSRIEF